MTGARRAQLNASGVRNLFSFSSRRAASRGWRRRVAIIRANLRLCNGGPVVRNQSRAGSVGGRVVVVVGGRGRGARQSDCCLDVEVRGMEIAQGG